MGLQSPTRYFPDGLRAQSNPISLNSACHGFYFPNKEPHEDEINEWDVKLNDQRKARAETWNMLVEWNSGNGRDGIKLRKYSDSVHRRYHSAKIRARDSYMLTNAPAYRSFATILLYFIYSLLFCIFHLFIVYWCFKCYLYYLKFHNTEIVPKDTVVFEIIPERVRYPYSPCVYWLCFSFLILKKPLETSIHCCIPNAILA